jgi:hypothetical protein
VRVARWLFGFAFCVAIPAAAGAQATQCSFTSDRASTDSTAVGIVAYYSGHVRVRCPARGITLVGDSAEHYPDHDFVIGHVIYDEPRAHITSDFLNYFSTDERVLAIGNVNARLPSGSTLVGPIAEYKRAVPRVRTRAQMTAKSRPTITIFEKDTTGKPPTPTVVVGETVFMDGDSLIYASGGVTITRPEITASGDSIFLDQTKETMRLMRNPELRGKKEKPYTLTGDLIDLYSKDKKLQRIIARANAKAVSDSMTLTADTIDLRVRNDLLDHAYAWGAKSRARVVSAAQNLLADSLDVTMPAQKIRLVRALNKAYAEGAPDTTRFILEKKTDKNWLRGDTITAHFDSTVTDTAKKNPDVRRLLASGHATSYYHLAPSDSAERRPAINYVSARVINIEFDKSKAGTIATVTTVDSVAGVYIEPKPDSAALRRNGPTNAPGQTKPLPASIIPLPPKRP